jgi:adenylate cyclase
MQATLATLNARWREQGRSELHIGIGIHQGDAFVGNIGSPRRLEFTLIGDTVNVANRLCSLAQAGEVLVSEAIVDAVRRTHSIAVRCTSRDELLVGRRNSGDCPVWQVEPGT